MVEERRSHPIAVGNPFLRHIDFSQRTNLRGSETDLESRNTFYKEVDQSEV
jgi:hypothetical protein